MRRSVLAAGLIALLGVGCGDGRPSLKEAQGTVMLDGKPLQGADVSLLPVAGDKSDYRRPSFGQTDAQGQFKVGTYGSKDGIPAGRYQVGVKKWEVVGDLPKNYDPDQPELTPVKYKWLTPKKYSVPQTSGLEVEISSNGMTPDKIELVSEGKPQIEVIGGRTRGDRAPRHAGGGSLRLDVDDVDAHDVSVLSAREG